MAGGSYLDTLRARDDVFDRDDPRLAAIQAADGFVAMPATRRQSRFDTVRVLAAVNLVVWSVVAIEVVLLVR